MISSILSKNITNITELKKNPVELSKHDETCVLSNGKPCFYSVSPERMGQLLRGEKEINSFMHEIQDLAVELMFMIQESRMDGEQVVKIAKDIHKLSLFEEL